MSDSYAQQKRRRLEKREAWIKDRINRANIPADTLSLVDRWVKEGRTAWAANLLALARGKVWR